MVTTQDVCNGRTVEAHAEVVLKAGKRHQVYRGPVVAVRSGTPGGRTQYGLYCLYANAPVEVEWVVGNSYRELDVEHVGGVETNRY